MGELGERNIDRVSPFVICVDHVDRDMLRRTWSAGFDGFEEVADEITAFIVSKTWMLSAGMR